MATRWPWTPTEESSSKPSIPVLFELLEHMKTGQSLTEWAKSHSEAQYRGEDWTMTARAALWLQANMLDSWIGSMIDHLMEATAMREVPIPATVEDANLCAESANVLPPTTAFNPVRARWLKLYLIRLADGYQGYGESFVSDDPRPVAEERWQGMEKGTVEEWLALDAVLTLRAATMYAMFMGLEDSSIPIDPEENDPLLYMS